MIYRRFGKRLVDVLFSTVALVLASPVLVVVALLIRLRMGGPVFFLQQRPGLGAEPFTMLKFRTMRNPEGALGEQLSDEKRLTPLGRCLRSSSIDELPEFINVLKGDMSIVGPRPLLPQYLSRYSTHQARRHEARPGVTGWAQVHGRNALTWTQKFDLDVWYVDHVSIALDFRIMVRTFRAVLKREGISAAGHETVPEFLN